MHAPSHLVNNKKTKFDKTYKKQTKFKDTVSSIYDKSFINRI